MIQLFLEEFVKFQTYLYIFLDFERFFFIKITRPTTIFSKYAGFQLFLTEIQYVFPMYFLDFERFSSKFTGIWTFTSKPTRL